MSYQRHHATPPKGTGTTPLSQPGVFDTLIQSSAVALFHDYGVAAAPLTPTFIGVEDFRAHYPLAAIGFRGPGMDAALILSIPREVSAHVRLEPGRPLDQRDLARELVNQAMGRIKNRLCQYQVTLKCGLPSSADTPRDLDRVAPQRGPLTVYRLRTIHAQILVATKGAIDPSSLVYSSTTVLNGEGDIIVF